jgi:hypothetical protein
MENIIKTRYIFKNLISLLFEGVNQARKVNGS